MNLNEYRAIKDYSYIEILIGDTYMKLDTTNSISFIYKDGNVYIKISSEVFTDDMKIYLWLSTRNSTTSSYPISDELLNAFVDQTTPVIHRKRG